jgi:transcriptional regulator with XRE-family HTH domain
VRYNCDMTATSGARVIQIGKKSFSRGEISRGANISLSHVSRIFGGTRAPSIAVLEQIAEFVQEEVATVLRAIMVHAKRELEAKYAMQSNSIQ